MERGLDTDRALEARWAADLVGLSVVWFISGPAIAATTGLGWATVSPRPDDDLLRP